MGEDGSERWSTGSNNTDLDLYKIPDRDARKDCFLIISRCEKKRGGGRVQNDLLIASSV